MCVLCQVGWTADSAHLIADLDQLSRTMSPLVFEFHVLAHKEAKKRIKHIASQCRALHVKCHTWDENNWDDATNLDTMLQLPITKAHAVLIISDTSVNSSDFSRSGSDKPTWACAKLCC